MPCSWGRLSHRRCYDYSNKQPTPSSRSAKLAHSPKIFGWKEMLTLSDNCGRSSTVTTPRDFQPCNRARDVCRGSRTISRSNKRRFDGIPVHNEYEFVQPLTSAPDVLNLIVEREEVVVQCEGDGDNYWEIYQLGGKRKWSSDIHSPMKYLVANNAGAPSRTALIISKSSASTSPIS